MKKAFLVFIMMLLSIFPSFAEDISLPKHWTYDEAKNYANYIHDHWRLLESSEHNNFLSAAYLNNDSIRYDKKDKHLYYTTETITIDQTKNIVEGVRLYKKEVSLASRRSRITYDDLLELNLHPYWLKLHPEAYYVHLGIGETLESFHLVDPDSVEEREINQVLKIIGLNPILGNTPHHWENIELGNRNSSYPFLSKSQGSLWICTDVYYYDQSSQIAKVYLKSSLSLGKENKPHLQFATVDLENKFIRVWTTSAYQNYPDRATYYSVLRDNDQDTVEGLVYNAIKDMVNRHM